MFNRLRLFTNPPAETPPVGCVDLVYNADSGEIGYRGQDGVLTALGVRLVDGVARGLAIEGLILGNESIGSGNDNIVGASVTLNIDRASIFFAKLTDATTTVFTMPDPTPGKAFTIFLRQAEPIGNGIATFTGVKWGTAGAPTITATPGKQDILDFSTDGVYWYGKYSQGYDYPP